MSLGEGSFTHTPLDFWVIVGKYSSIAPDCRFHYESNHLWVKNRECVYTTNWDQPHDGEKIIIGNDVWICEGVRVLQGLTIGDGAIIAAGSVVTKNVPPYAFVAGNPGRVKRYRFSKEIVARLLKLKWWDWPLELITKRREEMKNINTFLEKYDFND